VRRAGRLGLRRRGTDPIAGTRNGRGGNRREIGRGERGGAIGRLERLRRGAERTRLRGDAFSLGQEPAATSSEARHVGEWRGARGGKDAVRARGLCRRGRSRRGHPHRGHRGLRHGAARSLRGGDRRPGDRDERYEERDYEPLQERLSEFLWIGPSHRGSMRVTPTYPAPDILRRGGARHQHIKIGTFDRLLHPLTEEPRQPPILQWLAARLASRAVEGLAVGVRDPSHGRPTARAPLAHVIVHGVVLLRLLLWEGSRH